VSSQDQLIRMLSAHEFQHIKDIYKGNPVRYLHLLNVLFFAVTGYQLIVCDKVMCSLIDYVRTVAAYQVMCHVSSVKMD